jgi:two-component system, OmpR family, KDP operon response regulator KdpE
VLVLSVRDHERSKVEALDAGADDYVTKPFSIQELLARVRAHLRRAPERTTAAIEAGDFVVDSEAHTITVLGKPIHLTPKEFDLLLHLARHAGKVMTHRALLTAVWGAQSAHQPEYLRVFRRPVAQEARGRNRQAVHPDRALGGLPLHPRGLDRQRGMSEESAGQPLMCKED